MAYLNNCQTTDVVLKVGETDFPCHREKLCLHSPYFEAMFTHNFVEKEKGTIEIQNVEPEAMKILLSFTETKEIPDEVLKSEHLLSLLQASMMLQFDKVQKICISVITQEWLTVENCLQTMITAHALDIDPLYRKARALALWEFSSVKSTSAFFDFEIEGLEDYLGNNHLNANQGEFEVFDAGLTWVQEDPKTRSQYVNRILKCVHFSDVNASDIRTMFLYPNIAEDSQAFSTLQCVLMMKEKQSFCVSDRDDLMPEDQKSETDIEVGECGELKQGPGMHKRLRCESYKTSEICDRAESSNLGSKCFPKSCCCPGSSEENSICVCWGTTSRKSLPFDCAHQDIPSSNSSPVSERILDIQSCTEKSVKFDSETIALAIQLIDKPPRKLPLVPCVVGHTLNDKVDKMSGGKTNLRPYVIYFDESKSRLPQAFLHLTKINEGPVEPSGYRVINRGLDIFIIGGEFLFGFGNWNNTVWKYSVWKGEWTYETSLLSPRRHHSVCTFGDDIYIMGGFGRHRVIMDSVEKYNVHTRSWQQCAPLPRSMYSAPCCVHEGKIFVFGVEVCYYEVKSESWHTFSSSPVPASITYSSAVSHGEWIYLTGNYSPKLIRFSPSRNWSISSNSECPSYEYLGCFKYRPCSLCLVHHNIFCFTTDEQERLFVEKYDILEQNFEVVWEGNESEVNGICDFSPKHCIGCFPLIMY